MRFVFVLIRGFAVKAVLGPVVFRAQRLNSFIVWDVDIGFFFGLVGENFNFWVFDQGIWLVLNEFLSELAL